jgi:hypothetical protein
MHWNLQTRCQDKFFVFGNFPLDEKNTVVYVDFPLFFFATDRALSNDTAEIVHYQYHIPGKYVLEYLEEIDLLFLSSGYIKSNCAIFYQVSIDLEKYIWVMNDI